MSKVVPIPRANKLKKCDSICERNFDTCKLIWMTLIQCSFTDLFKVSASCFISTMSNDSHNSKWLNYCCANFWLKMLSKRRMFTILLKFGEKNSEYETIRLTIGNFSGFDINNISDMQARSQGGFEAISGVARGGQEGRGIGGKSPPPSQLD